MGTGGKYSIEERKIARKIWDIQTRQAQLFKQWHELDQLKFTLIKQLNGKYAEKTKGKAAAPTAAGPFH